MFDSMRTGKAFRRLPLLASAAILLYMTGCATIFRGSAQDVSVTSSPGGASVYVNGNSAGTTPCTVKLKRSESHVVRVELDGYRPYEVQLDKKLDIGWTVVSLWLGAGGGLIIDAITGAIYTIDPGTVSARFSNDSASIGSTEDGRFHIFVTMEKPGDDWVKVGQMEKINAN